MSKRENISMSVIRRLPRYYRFLSELSKNGVNRISSKELSNKMGLTASQIRQDLNCFGGFGQQGYGYCVEYLQKEIGNILGIYNQYPCILIGAGNLGQAVTSHILFNSKGFRLTCILDSSLNIIGKDIKGLIVEDIKNLKQVCNRYKPVMAILCTPKNSVKELYDQLYSLGIKNYWNFSHYDLISDHKDVIVENVHLSDSLMTLSYRITNSQAL